jgi:hypothetical protein
VLVPEDVAFGFKPALTVTFRLTESCQDNEPLMRALSKLINLNSPDLVLFVGEALVGNDAVDQLTKFNQVRSWFRDRWMLLNYMPSPVEFCFDD